MNSTDCTISASKRLAAYVVSRPGFRIVSQSPRHVHVGALLADCALQAGLNYRSVVLPRVVRIEKLFPSAATLGGLVAALDEMTASKFLNWTHHEKISRFESLVDFFLGRAETVDEIRSVLSSQDVRVDIIKLNGVGRKTVDYMARLSGAAEVAVDRHVVRFVEDAGIQHHGYVETKLIVNAAADLLGVSYDCFDASIWRFMSLDSRATMRQGTTQTEFSFV